MNRITLENYRCFREKQSARLAPLTLLVGNNSTGKTSFLALIRALWDAAFRNEAPDFREDPYDLGTFRDIAHNRGGGGGQASSFSAEFWYQEESLPSREAKEVEFHLQFEERNARPFPASQGFAHKNAVFLVHRRENGTNQFQFRARNDTDLKLEFLEDVAFGKRFLEGTRLATLSDWIWHIRFGQILGIRSPISKQTETQTAENSASNSLLPTEDNLAELESADLSLSFYSKQRPFASAPIRSRPRRTYDPIHPSPDPEGDYVPTYLANISYSDKKEWVRLKNSLETFGRASGLFDEIGIKLLGKTGGSPFQVQIRKSGHRLKGTKRNLIDVGYGVSQTLPLLTELLREDPPSMFLLQQPEVHLHPSAQAALGSLFCNLAGPERQLIVETHSDYILDRVRMDVRDNKTELNAEDVSILFFEPGELDVTIHSLRLDGEGNVLDAPDSYRDFFMAETRRSIGL